MRLTFAFLLLPAGIFGSNEQESFLPGPPISEEEFRASDMVKEELEPEEPGRDPMELPGLFEGDILLDPQMNSDTENRNAQRSRSYKWPGGIIPYVLTAKFTEHQRLMIAKAIKIYNNKTCIRIVPRTSEKYYVRIYRGGGCSSGIGFQNSRFQTMSLGPGCFRIGTILHEFMHTAGFYHEQARPDRTEHIVVNHTNIQPGNELNFRKYPVSKIDTLGAPYDLCSVMHYKATAFSKNGFPTIIPINKPTNCTMGQRDGFSDTDIRKLNTYYQCDGYPQVIRQHCENKNFFWCAWYAMSMQCSSPKQQSYIVENCKKFCGFC